MWWECCECGSKVDFSKQMKEVFSYEDEADFDVESGLWFHTIECDVCGHKEQEGANMYTIDIVGCGVIRATMGRASRFLDLCYRCYKKVEEVIGEEK